MASSSNDAPPLPPGPPPGKEKGLKLEEVKPMCAVLPEEELPDWSADDTEGSCEEGDLMAPLEPPQPEGEELQKALE